MKKYKCTCSLTKDEQQCKIHKKSRYRNIWKHEVYPQFIDKKKEK